MISPRESAPTPRAQATRERQRQLFIDLQKELDEAQARAKEEGARANQELAALTQQIAAAKTKAQRKLLSERRRRKAEAASAAAKRAARRERARINNAKRLSNIRCDPNDPLCGI